MGLYDTVHIKQKVDDLEDDIKSWQSKTIKEPMLDIYRIEDDKLKLQEYEVEELDEEDKRLSSYSDKTINKRQKNVTGYSDVQYHGEIEIHTVDRDKEEYISYKLKFTDGELVDCWEYERSEVDITSPEDLLDDE